MSTPMTVLMLQQTVYGAVWVDYGFGDAAQEGFGDKLKPLNLFLSIRIAFYCNEYSQKYLTIDSIAPLKNFITSKVDAGGLMGREVWIFTDNEVNERV